MKELRIIEIHIYRAFFDSPGRKIIIKIGKMVRIIGLSVPRKPLKKSLQNPWI